MAMQAAAQSLVLALIASLAVGDVPSASAQEPHGTGPAMRAEEIRAAVAVGREHKGTIKPHDLGKSGFLKFGRNGVLLMPFQRVAMAAQQAARTRRSFDESDVPPSLSQSLVWVIAFPRGVPEEPGDPGMIFSPMEGVFIRQRVTPGGAFEISPVWTLVCNRRHVSELEQLLGRRFEPLTLIAAFDLSAFRPGREIVFVQGGRASRTVITEKHIKAWLERGGVR